MTEPAPTLFAASVVLGAGTAALIGGGLAVFFGTIVQAILRLRNRPDDVDPRDALAAGRTIFLMLVGLWLAAGGVAWRVYDDANTPAESHSTAVTSPGESNQSAVSNEQ
jgi:hypothetical protein